MIRIWGIIFLSISLFLTMQSISTVYYDYFKNKVDESKVKELERVYATVDKIGVVTVEKEGKWYNLPPMILIFLCVLFLSSILMIFQPNKFPLKLLNSIELKSFFIILLLASTVLVSQYVKYFGKGSPPGRGEVGILLSKSVIIILAITLVFLVINKRIEVFKNGYSIVWLSLAFLMIANGFWIECYSSSSPAHSGDFAQFDYLGVAVYKGWSHNWTAGYTVFRVTNNVLILLGVFLISVLTSRLKQSTGQPAG